MVYLLVLMASSRGETLFENTTSRLRVCAFFPGFSDLKKYLEGELHLCRVNLVQMNQSLRILPVGGEKKVGPPWKSWIWPWWWWGGGGENSSKIHSLQRTESVEREIKTNLGERESGAGLWVNGSEGWSFNPFWYGLIEFWVFCY